VVSEGIAITVCLYCSPLRSPLFFLSPLLSRSQSHSLSLSPPLSLSPSLSSWKLILLMAVTVTWQGFGTTPRFCRRGCADLTGHPLPMKGHKCPRRKRKIVSDDMSRITGECVQGNFSSDGAEEATHHVPPLPVIPPLTAVPDDVSVTSDYIPVDSADGLTRIVPDDIPMSVHSDETAPLACESIHASLPSSESSDHLMDIAVPYIFPDSDPFTDTYIPSDMHSPNNNFMIFHDIPSSTGISSVNNAPWTSDSDFQLHLYDSELPLFSPIMQPLSLSFTDPPPFSQSSPSSASSGSSHLPTMPGPTQLGNVLSSTTSSVNDIDGESFLEAFISVLETNNEGQVIHDSDAIDANVIVDDEDSRKRKRGEDDHENEALAEVNETIQLVSGESESDVEEEDAPQKGDILPPYIANDRLRAKRYTDDIPLCCQIRIDSCT